MDAALTGTAALSLALLDRESRIPFDNELSQRCSFGMIDKLFREPLCVTLRRCAVSARPVMVSGDIWALVWSSLLDSSQVTGCRGGWEFRYVNCILSACGRSAERAGDASIPSNERRSQS